MSRNNNFIERSMMGAVSFIKEATLCEEHASRRGFAQLLDPRFKAISFLILIVTTVSLKNVILIGILYFFCLVLAFFSRIPLGLFLLRTWVFIPLFSLFIAVPAVFSFVTPGAVLWQAQIVGIKLVITQPGVASAVLFVARVLTSVSLAVLLSLTTRHGELLAALRSFGIPQIFILTLTMCYRYLYLFAVMVENICLAIKSRVGVIHSAVRGQRLVAWNIANIWSRANQMNQDVYLAMLSRGYTGEPRLSRRFQARTRDGVWLLFVTVICVGLLYGSTRFVLR